MEISFTSSIVGIFCLSYLADFNRRLKWIELSMIELSPLLELQRFLLKGSTLKSERSTPFNKRAKAPSYAVRGWFLLASYQN